MNEPLSHDINMISFKDLERIKYFNFFGITGDLVVITVYKGVVDNLSVLGFSFVFHDKAKRTKQGNLLALTHTF